MHLSAALAVVLVLAALTVITSLADRGRRRKRLTQLRVAWGAEKDTGRSMHAIARYHRALGDAGEGDSDAEVDDRTWSDLDLDSVFATLDRTASPVGQQVLYRRLRAPQFDRAELERFDALATAFGERPPLRDEVQLTLATLDVPGAYGLPELFLRPLPPPPPGAAVFPLLSIAAVASLVGIFFWPRALIALLVLSVANLVIRATLAERVSALVPTFRLLNRLVAVGEALARSPAPELAERSAALREATGRLAGLGRATRWVAWQGTSPEDLRRLPYEYLNNTLLLDVNALIFSLGEIGRRRADIRRTFEIVGEVDAALSVASFRAGREDWTRPRFDAPGASPAARAVVHPMVAEPVANDFVTNDRRGVLITGSNMSGKTTFLRAVGLNAVLAQTLCTCLAAEYAAPFLVVRSSIAHLDSVLEGKSYYMAEVESVLRLVHAASGDRRPHLFLLDELFRGTNAVERIAGAKAVLEHLATAPHTVLAATHDFELLELLAERYSPYHFRETVGEDGLSFDYVLRPGPATTRNAIKLLEVMGAPDEVVQNALRTAEALDEQRGLNV